jgi:adenine deaminase
MLLVREMQRADVLILAGTDVPRQSVPGYALHRELELLARAGLTPVEVLRTATVNPARYLGLPGHSGMIRAGDDADLVVLKANPLVDVANVEKIEMVSVQGHLLSRGELDRLIQSAHAALAGFHALNNLKELAVQSAKPVRSARPIVRSVGSVTGR